MTAIFKLAPFIVADVYGKPPTIHGIAGHQTRRAAVLHATELRENDRRNKTKCWEHLRVFCADELVAHVSLSRKADSSDV